MKRYFDELYKRINKIEGSNLIDKTNPPDYGVNLVVGFMDFGMRQLELYLDNRNIKHTDFDYVHNQVRLKTMSILPNEYSDPDKVTKLMYSALIDKLIDLSEFMHIFFIELRSEEQMERLANLHRSLLERKYHFNVIFLDFDIHSIFNILQDNPVDVLNLMPKFYRRLEESDDCSFIITRDYLKKYLLERKKWFENKEQIDNLIDRFMTSFEFIDPNKTIPIDEDGNFIKEEEIIIRNRLNTSFADFISFRNAKVKDYEYLFNDIFFVGHNQD